MFKTVDITEDQFYNFHARQMQHYNVFDALDEMMKEGQTSRVQRSIINIEKTRSEASVEIVSPSNIQHLRCMAVCVYIIDSMFRLTTVLSIHAPGFIDESLIEFSHDDSVSDEKITEVVELLFGEA